MFKYLHHADYVVRNLDETVAYMERNFGMRPDVLEDDEKGRWKAAHYRVGETLLRMREPTPGTVHAQFLEKHGPGVRHIGWCVDNISQVAQDLIAKGNTLRSNPQDEGGYHYDQRGYYELNIDLEEPLGIHFHLDEESEQGGDHSAGTPR